MLGLSLAMLVKPSLLAKFAKHLDRPIQSVVSRFFREAKAGTACKPNYP